MDNLLFVNAELEFLEMLINTCRVARDPKRKGRLEMAVPAAQWEMRFEARLAELKAVVPALASQKETVAA